ncbi:hypothetical protein ACFPVX_05960 [Cohnella faecalis]|uniref:Primosomal protein N' (Replication factor Y)-superfamily II helicase n=1 Tax=Cohnella faecalis TaxID=2315694 RepID=A0A398CI53_9BACL|nr:hypothetical protein [Cohnella faecalis]RIE02120.1 hypothetical protein D3H35_15285 [Cohnella faecalis]
MTMDAHTPPPTAVASFPCPGCGGSMQFDTESQALKCQYCGGERTIEHLMEEPREHPFAEEEDSAELLDWGTEQQSVRCESCGGESLIPLRQTATQCAFCGSPKVLPQGEARSGIRPESVIPFHVSLDGAAELFRKWKGKRWFVPNAFKKQNISSKLNGIYIPYWTYDTSTYSVYSAEVGIYHYRTETRTRVVNGKSETYTEQVRYTVWHWTKGDYDRAFDDILIPASGYYDKDLLRKLGDFDLGRLTGYKPEYLSGFIAERYSVSKSQGWTYAQAEADDQIRDDVRRQIGGDEIRNLNIRTNYGDITYKHLLLPVWNATYSYRSKSYRYMVNGQTGTVSGRVPRSPWKITFFVLACLAAAIGALWIYGNSQTP